ncbi:MAG: hypothetical protein ACQEQV_08330 [Fibrobacterota bacterium]
MKSINTVTVTRLHGISLVKLIVPGATLGGILLSLLFGIAAFFGGQVVQWNGQYITGVQGAVAAPFICGGIGFIFGLFVSLLTYIGLRFYSLFRPLTLKYVPVHDD